MTREHDGSISLVTLAQKHASSVLMDDIALVESRGGAWRLLVSGDVWDQMRREGLPRNIEGPFEWLPTGYGYRQASIELVVNVDAPPRTVEIVGAMQPFGPKADLFERYTPRGRRRR